MEKLNKKEDHMFTRWIFWIFNNLFCIVFLGLFISLCFFNNGFYKYNVIITLVAAIFVLGLGVFIYYHIRKCKVLKTQPYKVMVISMGVIFILQMIYVCLTTTSIGWDVGMVVGSAISDNPTENSLYFSRNTNNLFLAFSFRFVAYLYRIAFGNVEYIWHVLSVINVIAIDISIVLIFFIGKKMFSLKIAYIAYGLSVLLFGFFPWIIVPYSDTLAMPFTVLIFWLFLLLKDARKLRYRILLSVVIGSITFIGYLIKPTVVIVLIAALLITLVSTIGKWKNMVISMTSFFVIFATFAGGNPLWGKFIDQQNTYMLDKDIQIPFTHFIMMGMKEVKMGTEEDSPIYYGSYNVEDVSATFSKASTKEMQEMHLEVIKERFRNYGALGYLKFLINKARWVTSEGQFFWGLEGNFANYDNQSNFLANIIYNVNPSYNIYLYYSQGIWLFVFFMIVYPLFTKNKKEKYYYSVGISFIRCTIVGILLFILLFEGRSRYLILYLPYFSLLAAYGLLQLGDKVAKRWESENIWRHWHLKVIHKKKRE